MNRIILIGNGFDLAHGLPTSYKHFIDDLWAEKYEFFTRNYEDDDLIVLPPFKEKEVITCYIQFQNLAESEGITITYKNYFLKQISQKCSLKNWVDIENEYYDILKILLEKKQKEHNIPKEYGIKDLNKEFNSIKIYLYNYLKGVIKNQSNAKGLILNNMLSPIKIRDLNKDGVNALIDEFFLDINNLSSQNKLNRYQLEYYDKFLTNKNKEEFYCAILNASQPNELELKPSNLLFLSFNYTPTEAIYHEWIDIPLSLIRIHGNLGFTDIKDTENPMIFGYGDELDDYYKKIEALNDNRYLENIKSIGYLKTPNYKKLLNYIESDKYQIYIFGHSCGNSDRTLLNKLFEHDNCVSIKVFYYKEKNGSCNYNDIVMNISRNFNNKSLLRERVVNESYCCALS